MSDARGIQPMQTCLGDNNRPLGMAAAHQPQDAQHGILSRVGNLHRDQEKVRPPLAPGNVRGRVVVHLAEPARIKKPKEWRLGGHIIECCASRARRKSFPDRRPCVACEGGYDGGLPRPGLAEEPNHGSRDLSPRADILEMGTRFCRVAEKRLADGVPEPAQYHVRCPRVSLALLMFRMQACE